MGHCLLGKFSLSLYLEVSIENRMGICTRVRDSNGMKSIQANCDLRDNNKVMEVIKLVVCLGWFT